MKKFECKGCEADCEVTIQTDDFGPSFCLYDTTEVNWHEVKEDSAENAQTEQFLNSEQLPSNPRKLPDWFKVGEYMYLSEKGKYFKITEDFMNVNLIGEKITAILAGKIIQARKRPFNADEMKALVGKIIEFKNGDTTLATGYSKEFDEGVEGYSYGIWTCWGWSMGAKELMNECTIDGKPCYKLEHLENGEWVE